MTVKYCNIVLDLLLDIVSGCDPEEHVKHQGLFSLMMFDVTFVLNSNLYLVLVFH